MKLPHLIQGDSRDVLRGIADDTFHSCVTDPPYALVSIMKRFGADDAVPAKSGATAVYTRASAGFMGQKWDTGETAFDPAFWREVLRVMKPGAHLLAFGGTRTYHRLASAIEDAGFEIRDMVQWIYGSGFPKSHNQHGDWEGWGTALKPASEPIVLARKSLGEKTIALNVLAHGTGALNIDGCRVPNVTVNGGSLALNTHLRSSVRRAKGDSIFNTSTTEQAFSPSDLGRWPANVVHDGSEEVVREFPNSRGQQGDVKGTEPSGVTKDIYGKFNERFAAPARNDGGGSAARFFYCAKASAKDRRGSKHPTVKPISLLRWLVRLITPPDGVVFDPFAGTGTTGEAAFLEGMSSTLIEREPAYADDCRARIAECAKMQREEREVTLAASQIEMFGEG